MNNSIARNLTVVIPYYNHFEFLIDRLDSIVQQSVQPASIIIVDDASEFEIDLVITNYASRSNIPITFIKNFKNNGIPTLTWYQLLKIVQTEYVWIAECDDSSEIDFIELILPLFNDQKICLAMCASKTIDENGNNSITNNHKNLFSKINWDSPFNMSILEFKQSALFYGNPIENVSSCIFRTAKMIEALNKTKHTFKLCCDWEVYLNLADEAYVSYIPNKLNKFRVHANTQRAKNNSIDILHEKYQIYKQILEKASEMNFSLNLENLIQIIRGSEIPQEYYDLLNYELNSFDSINQIDTRPKVLILRTSANLQDYYKYFFIEKKYIFSAFFQIIEIIDWWEYDQFTLNRLERDFSLILNFDIQQDISNFHSKVVNVIDFDDSDIKFYISIVKGSFILLNLRSQNIFKNSEDKNILWFPKTLNELKTYDLLFETIDFIKANIIEKS